MSNNLAELLTILERQSGQTSDIASQLSDLNNRLNEMQYSSMKTPKDSDKSIITLQQYKDSLANADQMFLAIAKTEFQEVIPIRYEFKLLITSIEIIISDI